MGLHRRCVAVQIGGAAGPCGVAPPPGPCGCAAPCQPCPVPSTPSTPTPRIIIVVTRSPTRYASCPIARLVLISSPDRALGLLGHHPFHRCYSSIVVVRLLSFIVVRRRSSSFVLVVVASSVVAAHHSSLVVICRRSLSLIVGRHCSLSAVIDRYPLSSFVVVSHRSPLFVLVRRQPSSLI